MPGIWLVPVCMCVTFYIHKHLNYFLRIKISCHKYLDVL